MWVYNTSFAAHNIVYLVEDLWDFGIVEIPTFADSTSPISI